ncbi:hypothetical protein HN928_06850, partial [bacterium]|nr:hypothetical protein [bacterium]
MSKKSKNEGILNNLYKIVAVKQGALLHGDIKKPKNGAELLITLYNGLAPTRLLERTKGLTTPMFADVLGKTGSGTPVQNLATEIVQTSFGREKRGYGISAKAQWGGVRVALANTASQLTDEAAIKARFVTNGGTLATDVAGLFEGLAGSRDLIMASKHDRGQLRVLFNELIEPYVIKEAKLVFVASLGDQLPGRVHEKQKGETYDVSIDRTPNVVQGFLSVLEGDDAAAQELLAFTLVEDVHQGNGVLLRALLAEMTGKIGDNLTFKSDYSNQSKKLIAALKVVAPMDDKLSEVFGDAGLNTEQDSFDTGKCAALGRRFVTKEGVSQTDQVVPVGVTEYSDCKKPLDFLRVDLKLYAQKVNPEGYKALVDEKVLSPAASLRGAFQAIAQSSARFSVKEAVKLAGDIDVLSREKLPIEPGEDKKTFDKRVLEAEKALDTEIPRVLKDLGRATEIRGADFDKGGVLHSTSTLANQLRHVAKYQLHVA